jgi:hypothetical protein
MSSPLGDFPAPIAKMAAAASSSDRPPRIALLLSGHVRTFTDCLPNLRKHVIAKYNPDIFIHTWSSHGFTVNGVGMEYYDQVPREKLQPHYDTQDPLWEESPDVDRRIFEGLNIKELIIERREQVMPTIERRLKDVPIGGTGGSRSLCNTYYSQLRKITLINRLKMDYERKNGFTYDIVIRTRPDVRFFPNVIHPLLNSPDPELLKNTIYVNAQYRDQCSISNSKNVLLYEEIFKNFEKYLAEGFVNLEQMIAEHLRRKALNADYRQLIWVQKTTHTSDLLKNLHSGTPSEPVGADLLWGG